ncbi:hypothetical protein ASG43_19120 [Aureimonas sp. Leaf454]|uniref:hypothetical protein n=1 Tax=Aureimonas sp. Leaf454 TaxID=1736381 RepID=UPI000700CDD5|nr:hypothetical protein [Aureimonas sp. Leaf454]KQT53171.1 hypothetical protein ASG43_19120 [Aureimonas sp. Leaf454]
MLATLALAATTGTAGAQSMSPMRGVVDSFTEGFALRVYPSNPYDQRIRVEIKVYDQDFHEVRADVRPADFTLAAGASRKVTVVVPFAGVADRKVRVCTESIPFPNQQTQIRTQVCGKFLGRRRS